MMHKLKLTYFDFHGGRGEPARLAMHIGSIKFEDYRFPLDQFPLVKETTPLKQVPTLTVDGHQVTQSKGINRFVAKLANLYPSDNFQALLCDEIMDAVDDVISKLVATFGLKGEEQKNAREALVAGVLNRYLRWAEDRLAEQGGQNFVENRLTIADLMVFVWIRSLNSGNLDHIPTNLVEQVAPKLNAHYQRIANTPAIIDYYAKRS